MAEMITSAAKIGSETGPHDAPLRDVIGQILEGHFSNGNTISDKLYDDLLALVEVPFLKKIMEYTDNNQSLAAKVLKISRGTLRKKLKSYDML